MNLRGLNQYQLAKMSDEQFRSVLTSTLNEQRRDRRENQLLYYQPASTKAMRVHELGTKVLGIGGGNGSGKTETALVEMIILATGVIPDSLRDVESVRKKIRGPVKCRVICESLTTVLHPIILPKLKWWEWSGVSFPGGDKGHWGWIPRDCLIGGSWDKSWSEKLRMLRVYHRNPDDPSEIQGESTIQFMSRDQDPTDFASGDFHFVLFDEPPTYAIWRENEARTMRVAGRLMLAMTWPDDPAIPVDWLFDEIYDKAQPGPNKSENHDWVNIWTTDNRNLDQDAVSTQAASWSDEVRDVRIYGKPIRFSSRIHPLFTPSTDWWCFSCGRTISPVENKCTCGAKDILAFTHVVPIEPHAAWPTVWVLDPHPRKPHMFAWIQISPEDDWWVVREGEVDGSPEEVRAYVDRVESGLGLGIARRLIDPNMGRNLSSSNRTVTWQDEFDGVGLVTDLAVSDTETGWSRINTMLKPDPHTRRPRLMVDVSCEKMIFQMQRFVWDDYKQALEKAQKQKPKEKYDDFPGILRYLANSDPSFYDLREGGQIFHRNDPRMREANRRAHRNVVRTPSAARM